MTIILASYVKMFNYVQIMKLFCDSHLDISC